MSALVEYDTCRTPMQSPVRCMSLLSSGTDAIADVRAWLQDRALGEMRAEHEAHVAQARVQHQEAMDALRDKHLGEVDDILKKSTRARERSVRLINERNHEIARLRHVVYGTRDGNVDASGVGPAREAPSSGCLHGIVCMLRHQFHTTLAT
eukprot:m.1057584 g.1057584  ORF g.1057584 m.1057584 type:complete len:151 (+) comp24205_c0_seq32:2616-3068(+)